MSIFTSLFKPQWLNHDPAKRMAALANLSDITIVKRIAREDPAPPIRAAALRRIADDAFLWECIQQEHAASVREVALEHLLDQHTIGLAAQAVQLPVDLRVLAISRLSDQAILEKLALHDVSKEVRKAAVAKIQNREVLRHVIDDDRSRAVAILAEERLSGTSRYKSGG